MKPRRTHTSTSVYPLGGGDLWVPETFDSEQPDMPIVYSVWEPTVEERVAIAAGANIELAVWGGQPPVAIETTTVPLGRPLTEEQG